MKNNRFKLIIEPLSPLHIGNGEMLTSVGEFITTANSIRYLNLDELDNLLEEKDLIDNYTEKILNAGVTFDTLKTLTDFGIDIEQFISSEIELKSKDLNPLNNNSLHVFHNEFGKRYIPGSSVKGMIKSALLFHFLSLDKSYIYDLEKLIIDKFDALKRKDALRQLKKKWENILNQDLIFIRREFNNFRPNDSRFIENGDVQIEQVKRQHLFGVESENLDWLQETIKAGAKIDMEITIVPEFSGFFDFLNKPDLITIFEIINRFSSQMIDFEITLLNKSQYENKGNLITKLNNLKLEINSSENEFAICRLGKGKTIFFNTILPLLSTRALDMVIEKFKKPEEENKNFPLTRVLTAFDEMPGWIRISMISANSHDYSTKPKTQKKLEPEMIFEICNNTLTEINDKISEIKANFVSSKEVTFTLNGKLYENVQLINKLKREFKKNEPISVIIWQSTIKGIHQVKLEE